MWSGYNFWLTGCHLLLDLAHCPPETVHHAAQFVPSDAVFVELLYLVDRPTHARECFHGGHYGVLSFHEN